MHELLKRLSPDEVDQISISGGFKREPYELLTRR